MDFYVIPPVSNLELMHEGDRYFCLAQLYKKYPHYREFFKEQVKRGAWVTLDNGAGDHETVTREQVLEIARELQPSELIPLDILFNSKKTIDNLEWTIEQMKNDMHLRHIEILACPQGESLSQWLDTYQYMLNSSKVDTIGMSKLAIPYVMSGVKGGDTNIARDRNEMYATLKQNNLLEKPLHFLGAGEPWEFEAYQGDSLVRSTDSCFSIWGGMNGQRFEDPNYKRIATPKDYFDKVINPNSMDDIRSNFQYMKNITK